MADKLSLKWIEGNTNATTPSTDETPTFNVDNPQMWMPLSVISGLASGFCERRAVLDPVFITGTTTDQNSVQVNVEKNWYDDGPEARDEIARNCMHNLAVGSSGDANLYQSTTNAMFAPIGSHGTSNYMTAMDAAITTLISGETAKYVTPNNQDWTFGDLAAAAKQTADATGVEESAIALPTSNGLPSLNAGIALNTPVEWAKERKWMLDELKWAVTVGGGTSYAADAAANYITISSGNAEGPTAQEAYDSTWIDADTRWSSDTTYPDVYRDLTSSAAVITVDDYIKCDIKGLPFKLFMQVSSANSTGPVAWEMSINTDDRESYILGNGQTMYLETAEQIKGAMTARVYLDTVPLPYYPIPVTQDGNTTYIVSTVSESVTAAANVTLYKVIDGGTLIVPNGVSVNNVLVKGGTVDISNGGYIKYCTVLPPGQITGIKNVDYLSLDGMQIRNHNYEHVAAAAGTQYTIIQGTQNNSYTKVIATGDDEVTTPSSYYVKSGGTLVFSASYNILDYLQTNEQNNARIFVDSGGCLIIKGSPELPRIDIYKDQTAQQEQQSVTFGRHCPHDIVVGNTTYYCWHQAYDPTSVIPIELYTTSIPRDEVAWDVANVVLYRNNGTLTTPSFVATTHIIQTNGSDTTEAYVDYDDDAVARLRCPIVVLSGGTCMWGLHTRFGQGETDYYGNSIFLAYPGATVKFSGEYKNGWIWNGGADGFEVTTQAAMTDLTNLTYYRMMNTVPGTVDWTGDPGMGIGWGNGMEPVDYTILTYNDGVPTPVKPTIYDVFGATYYNYYLQDDPFAVTGGTPTLYDTTQAGVDPMGTRIFHNVTCLMFNPLDFTYALTGGTATSVTKGWNNITVSGMSLYGLKCIRIPEQGSSTDYYNDTVFFYVKRAGGEWIRRDLAATLTDQQLDPATVSIVMLIAMSSTAPTTYEVGDTYYNTTSKKLFTAEAIESGGVVTGKQWPTTGVDPILNGLYYDLSTGTLYQWTGTGSSAAMTELPIDGYYYPKSIYPELVYTPSGYQQKTRLYSDAAYSVPADIEIYSLSYPLLTGSTVHVPDSPTYGFFLGGHSGDAYAIYLCSIVDIEVNTTGTGAPVNHYQEFKVRQFQQPPVVTLTT